MKLYSIPLSPSAARVRLSIYRKGLEDRIEIVRPPEGGTRGEAFLAISPMGQVPTLELDGGAWAVGGRASIADSALIPVLNVVTLVGMVYQQLDLLTQYPKVAAYREAAREEPVHARVIGEQMAAVPNP